MKNEYKVTKQLVRSWAKEYQIYGGRNIFLFVFWCLMAVCSSIMTVLLLLNLKEQKGIYIFIFILALSLYKMFLERFVVSSRRYNLLKNTYGVSEWTRTIEFLEMIF